MRSEHFFESFCYLIIKQKIQTQSQLSPFVNQHHLRTMETNKFDLFWWPRFEAPPVQCLGIPTRPYSKIGAYLCIILACLSWLIQEHGHMESSVTKSTVSLTVHTNTDFHYITLVTWHYDVYLHKSIFNKLFLQPAAVLVGNQTACTALPGTTKRMSFFKRF